MAKMRQTAKLTAGWSAARAVWAIIFFAWGFGWLLVLMGDLFSLSFSTSVGVGTSSYIAARATIWIGGLLLFGLAALMCPPKHELTGTSVTIDDAETDPEYPHIHRGFPYRMEPDGSVIVKTEDGPVRYAGWSQFWGAIN